MPDLSPVQGVPVFRVVCSYCPIVLVEGDKGAPVSHGLCPDCDVRIRREYGLDEVAA